MAQLGTHADEDLQLLDIKIKQLRNEYEQYFMGSRPREPQQLRSEVQKILTFYTNVPLSNTAHRFRFNNLQARFFSLRRHWDNTQRKIEEGAYERHVFKARMHGRGAPPRAAAKAPPERTDGEALFSRYVEARQSCGQDTKSLDPGKLDALLERQRRALRERYGCKDVRFRVVVEEGRAKLKASPVA